MKTLILCVFFVAALSYVHKAHPCNFGESCGIHDLKRVGRADGNKLHTVSIHLRQNDFAASCDSLLQEVSDPRVYSFLWSFAYLSSHN
jgi:hypothetical protein